jgi:lipoate-protein ligase B
MEFRSLPGLIPYEAARSLQYELVEKRAKDEIEDTVLFLEHEAVITQGRGLQWTGQPRERHMPLPALPSEIAFSESERGGDLTYHGPGQLVIYPIVKLDGKGFGPDHDIGAYIRKLERLMIDDLAELKLTAEQEESATGVWVDKRKVASIGIAVRKWVTYHGVAINVVNDLKPFHLISPCGFQPDVMTNLKALLPKQKELQSDQWRTWLERRYENRFTQNVLA